MARRSISLSLRFSVYERDKHTCQYCGRKSPEVDLQIDHVHPVSLGGDDRIDNLLTACRDCNIGKGARDPGLAMPSRPPTYGERRVVTKDGALTWAELALPGAAAAVRALMWQIAARAEPDGVFVILSDLAAGERIEIERLITGLIAVGGVRTKARSTILGNEEWWLTIEHRRAASYDPELCWGLGATGPVAHAPDVSEVH